MGRCICCCCCFELYLAVTSKWSPHLIYLFNKLLETTSSQVPLAPTRWLGVRETSSPFLQNIGKYCLLFHNYRNTSCVSSSFFLTLFVCSVCWWTDFTDELIEQMLRTIPSGNFFRIFQEVHATAMLFPLIFASLTSYSVTFWCITKITDIITKESPWKDATYHRHLSGAKWTIKTLSLKDREQMAIDKWQQWPMINWSPQLVRQLGNVAGVDWLVVWMKYICFNFRICERRVQ